MILFKKEYDGESIVDISRDISEAFQEKFNHRVKNIPVDMHGFPQGVFKVTVVWELEDKP